MVEVVAIRRQMTGHIISAAVIFMLLALCSFWAVFETQELFFYDTWFGLRGPIAPGNRIAIVAMDEKSIAKLGPLPWDRKIHAQLIDRLSEAKVIGFDVLFDAARKSDAVFSQKIALQGHVVLASMFTFEQNKSGQWLQAMRMPAKSLYNASADTGYINMSAGKGSIVHNVTIFDTNFLARPYPSLSLAMTKLAEGNSLVCKGNSFFDRGRLIPADAANSILIDFCGPGGTFPTYSCSDVISGKYPKAEFKNKLILVGIATPTEKSDYYDNPYTKGNLVMKGAALPSPGVEIHANTIRTYLDHTWFVRASTFANIVALLGVCLLAFAASVLLSPGRAFWTTLLLWAGFVGGVYVCWLKLHFWLNIVAPALAAILIFAVINIRKYIMNEKEKAKIRGMFGKYVPDTVINELLINDREIALGGTKRTVTVLFTDLRGFTEISDGRPPEEVVSILNEYFTVMTAVIFKHGGMLDKFIGDAMMAIFGAPVEQPDHAAKALAAGCEMLDVLAELNQKWETEGKIKLAMGIGINSGDVVLGNIGSPERMDYTVIGENVNIASRLESMSKALGSPLVVSARTVRHLDAAAVRYFGLQSVGMCKVRGMKEELQLFCPEKYMRDYSETMGGTDSHILLL